MESLPPLSFALGTGIYRPTRTMSRREERQIRRQNEETLKRLRPDSMPTLKPFSNTHFKNTISIPQLFPSLLSILDDVPSYIKILLSTEEKSLRGRHDCIQKRIYDNLHLNRTIAKIPKGAFGYSDTPTSGLLHDHIVDLQKWISLEQKVRTQMRRLVQHWLYRRYKNRTHNDTDPCTLEPIVNPVRIFDVSSKGYYQFDAKSLRRTIEFGLGFQDWMFPEPTIPKNPLTNLEFNYGQLAAIQVGIRQAGLGSWMMEAFTKSNWNLEQFRLNYSVSLKLNAVHSLYKNPKSDQTQDFLIEFIEDQWEAHDMTKFNIKTILKWAVVHEMEDPYMQKWLDAWYEYFKIKVQYGIRDASSDRLNAIFAKTLLLLENSAKIAEFGERRVVSMGIPRHATVRRTLSVALPLPSVAIPLSTIRTYQTNPMLATQPSIILNPEEHESSSDEEESKEETEDEAITFSTPQEIASFMEFISQIFGENEDTEENNSQA